ncbi:hypothetical protein [Desulfitobacterium sp.]|uniref:hypothetical protein n=1 Tax=Desulfitobacterium sp. TaxID=49981 RepID=UPI002CBE6192|nr:hypothetical protein [Desulfitobacterium sp.]HVJ49830.1 hypothetical protein [Desulfitobacterium sp.]
MSIGMGIRVGPKAVHFTVVKSLPDDQFELLLIDKINIPGAMDEPYKLSYLRTNLLSIIMRFNVTNAGIRITEGTAQTVSTFRIYLEGVIQELFADSPVEKYSLSKKTTIARYLGKTIDNITDYFEGRNDFVGIPDIPKSHLEKRESILTALAALEL